MESNLALSLDMVKAIRKGIENKLMQDERGKALYGISKDSTYQVMLCDIFEMLYLLLMENGDYSDNNGSKRE